MGKCKCGTRSRIVSSVVQSMNCGGCCRDVCSNPICGDPSLLSILAPLIYDEIGINLCTTITLADIPATATKATLRVINATYTYGDTGVEVTGITGRQNCYAVTLRNITVQFAMNYYDDSCRLVGTTYPTALYLPTDTTAETYDEDTNPTSVELELFAPYGVTYDATAATPTPVLNYIGFATTNNYIRQGINLSAMAKLIDLDIEDSTATIGVTLVLQSLYYAGYKVQSAGKIDTPKGSIISPENSDCMKFVAGDLLNLEIKPLDLGYPYYEEDMKQDCADEPSSCAGSCSCESLMENNCQ